MTTKACFRGTVWLSPIAWCQVMSQLMPKCERTFPNEVNSVGNSSMELYNVVKRYQKCNLQLAQANLQKKGKLA